MMRYLFVMMTVLLTYPLPAQTLSVVHEKTLWRDGRGMIEITAEGITYKAEKAGDSCTWLYRDIQHFDRISDKEFSILSYDDQKLLLGRDREFRFRITKGALTDRLFEYIASRLGKPVTDRVVEETDDPEYSIPVKHLHTFGGCQGTLEFTKDAIYYRTDDKEDARKWRIDREIQSVWSADPYRLDIYAYDNNRREFSKARVYRFELKRPLDPAFYRKLKMQLYDLEK